MCGGVTELAKAGFDILRRLDTALKLHILNVYEMKLIVDMINQSGLSYMRYSISDTAEYGDYSVGRRIITEDTRNEMRKVLSEIQDGTFARNWILENKANRPSFNAMRKREQNHPIETVGKKLRKMMSWLKK